MIKIKPQKGPQEIFLSTPADIAIYGGAAGGGKTYALLLENLRHINNSKFGSVIFRRNAQQILNEGGLWDNALELYPKIGAVPKLTPRPVMVFPSGAKVSFAHLQYDSDVHSWQGSQIPLICFDELTHFTRKQFFYMLSRNRSLCGIKPYIRATTNPDAESWVADFIEWWIDERGYPISERSGVIRYFIVLDDDVKWSDNPQQLSDRFNVRIEDTKSFTFISSSIQDNKILLEKDPGYLANLKALSTVERERLLNGNWKIKQQAGLYFKRTQVDIVSAIPGKIRSIIRAWDLAATVPTPDNPSPDATAGVLIAVLHDGRYIILDVIHGRWGAADVRRIVRNAAEIDRKKYGYVKIRLSQDPGQAGKEQVESYIKHLTGFAVRVQKESGDKVTRAEPFSAQWQVGNVLILAEAWNNEYFAELEGFPEGKHDDMVDASANGFTELQSSRSWGGVTS